MPVKPKLKPKQKPKQEPKSETQDESTNEEASFWDLGNPLLAAMECVEDLGSTLLGDVFDGPKTAAKEETEDETSEDQDESAGTDTRSGQNININLGDLFKRVKRPKPAATEEEGPPPGKQKQSEKPAE